MRGFCGKTISLITCFVLLILIGLFFSKARSYGISNEMVRLERGWTILFKGNSYEVENASSFKMPFRATTGDTIVLENRIPEKLPRHPELRFRTYHSTVEVFVDSSVIYSYGMDKLGDFPFLGSGIHYVVFPPSTEGHSLRILSVVESPDSFSAFPNFDFLPAEHSISDYNAVHLMEIMVGLFLVLFGMISVLASTVVKVLGTSSFRFFMIGIVSFLLGLWTLCYMKLMQTFSMNFVFNTLLEFFTLFLTPIPFGMLLYDMSKDSTKPWKEKTLKFFIGFDVVFVIVAAVLQWLEILPVNKILPVFHIYVFIAFLFIVTNILA